MEKRKGKIKFKKFLYILLFSLLMCLFIITNSVLSFFSSSTKTTLIGAIDEDYLADGEVDGGFLNDYNLTKMVKIEGSEEEGYYFTFPEEEVKKILDITLFEEDVRYRDWGTNDIEALMDFIKAEIFTGLPNIGKDPENIKTSGDKIQGAVKFKRQTFNKNIGDYEKEVVNDETTQADTSEHIIAIDAGHGNPDDGQVTNSYNDIATSEEELNDGKAKYIRGNSGEDSEGNEYKEWELNQKVVDLVIEKLSNNPSIKIIQTGKDQPDYKRLQLAKDAGAEAYISVHFNERNSTRGTEVWASATEYTENGKKIELGDNTESIDLGTTLMNSISGQMNMGVATNKVKELYKEIKSTLKTSEECGIPNVYVFGNNMQEDVLDALMADNEKALDDYAQGIVNGILEYFDTADNISETGEVNADVNERYLTYVSPEEFDNMINNGNDEVLEHFTLDDDMKMIVATWTYSDSTGKILRRATANEYTTKIKPYIMPYQYPLAFLQDTGAEKFSKELANLSLNSDLVMTVFDNVTVNVDKVITTVTTQEQIHTWTTETITNVNGNSETYTANRQYGDIVSTQQDPNIVTTASETSSVVLELTYADAWCVEYEKFYKDERNDTGFTRVGEIQKTESPWTYGEAIRKNSETTDLGTELAYYENTNTRTITEVENQNKTVTYQFKENPNREPVLSGNTSKFVKLLRAHTSTALTNIESDNGQGLIEILANRAATANMVELTKWLLQETSKSIYFGLVKYNFEEFDPDNFKSVSTGISSSNIILDYLKSWENGTLWSYVKGETEYSDYVARFITQDKKQYICFTDGDGRLNFGYGMCHYYNGHFNHVELYESLGIDITQYNQIGMTIDVEIVDKAKLQFVNGVRQSVNAKISAAGIKLESYQIDALIALAYQWGDHIIDDFIPAYQQYGNTEELRQNFVNSNDPLDIPFLNGNGSSGSSYEVQRANANWTLFHEGRYLTQSGEELNPSDYITTGNVGELVEQNQNGIYGTYTASSGKTFIEYRQCSGPWGTPPWASVPYWDGTISSSGCGPTSAAIALTGYEISVTPEDTANAISNKYGSSTQTTPEALTWVVNNFGISAHTDGWGNVSSDKIANNLRQGRPVLISVGTSPDTMFTSWGHLMALVDIDSNNNVYVSNPSTTAHGWIPLNTVIQYCSYKWAVYFDE